MKIKHQEIHIPPEAPFSNCKLGREPYAKVLTDIVGNYADGFVLAVNNEWGTGKTTFVKMWQQQLKNKGFQTIYFNAWENDFDSNPLVAIMAELKSLTNAKNEKLFKTVVEKGAILVKNVVPALTKAFLKKYTGLDETALETIKNTTSGITEILKDEIDEYVNKKETLKEFRKDLEKFVSDNNDGKPLVFIIDELDRCRPDYAVEVLEQMKHFYSVSGIVFVLSIDKNHLASSVRGFYGSEHINTDEYLRRFIDLEYSIPKPSGKDFSKYLFDYYSFKDFFSSEERKKHKGFQSDAEQLLKMAEQLFKKSNATLRQQEKIFGLTRLVLCSFESNEYTFSHLLFTLVYLKTMKNDTFQKIERNEFSLQELSNLFFETVCLEQNEIYGMNLLYVEALMLWFYNNDQDYQMRIELFEKNETGSLTTPIKSKLENKSSMKNLAQCFENIAHQWDFDDKGLSYLISKINLTEPIMVQ